MGKESADSTSHGSGDLRLFLTLYAVAGSWPLPGGGSPLWHRAYRLLMMTNCSLTVALMVRDARLATSVATTVGQLALASALLANTLLSLGALARRPRLLRLAGRMRQLPPLPARRRLQRQVVRATLATTAMLSTHIALQMLYCLLCEPDQLLTDIRYPPLDLGRPRVRQLLLVVLQGSVVFYNIYTFTAFVGLFMYLSVQVRAHLSAISDALTHQAADIDLRAIVHHHQEVLSFLSEMEAVYHPLLLLDFLPLVVVICLMAFVLISMEGVDLMFVQTLTIFFLYFLNVGTFCFFGTQITSQAEAVSLSAYSSGWEERGRAFSSAVLLVLQRAQRPFTLTAGKFAPVSITTFSQMMQDAFSYLMVMRTLIGSKDHASPATAVVGAANHTLVI